MSFRLPRDAAKVIQENHYYPFGQNMVGIEELDQQSLSSQEEQKFQYNAKEKLDEFGLFWNDHGARNLDLQTGRWTSIDPLAEKYAPFSPYVAMGNNPVITIDPNGGENIVVIGNQGESPKSDLSLRSNKNQRHFLERGFKEAMKLHKSNRENGELTTMLAYAGNYAQSEIDYYQQKAEKAGLKFTVVKGADEIVDYVNTNGGYVNGKQVGRGKDLITDFTYVGHGKNDALLTGYNAVEYEADEDWIDTKQFSKYSFHPDANANLLGCGNGFEVFDDFQNRLAGGSVKGYRVTVIWGGSLGNFTPNNKEYFPPGDPRRNSANREIVPKEFRTRNEQGKPNNGAPNNRLVNGNPLNND